MAKKNKNDILDAFWNEELYEFVNWSTLPKRIGNMSDIINGKQSAYLICKPDYNTINPDYINAYNKKQPIMMVEVIKEIGDKFVNDGEFWLPMGMRLKNALKIARQSNWKIVEIVRVGEKFETQYYIREINIPEISTMQEFLDNWS